MGFAAMSVALARHGVLGQPSRRLLGLGFHLDEVHVVLPSSAFDAVAFWKSDRRCASHRGGTRKGGQSPSLLAKAFCSSYTDPTASRSASQVLVLHK